MDVNGRLGFTTKTTWQGVQNLLCCFILYHILRALYNVTLHPLANFPGPKLAGASYAYEAYFDLIRWGSYSKEIKRLHEKHGTLDVQLNDGNLLLTEV
jgi:hypothetical protein